MNNTNNSSQFGNHQYTYQNEPLTQVKIGNVILTVPVSAAGEIDKYRKRCMIAGGMAITSLFIGGVILAAVSVIVGFIAYRNLNEIASRFDAGSPGATALKRTGFTALIVCIVALVLNAIVVMLMWPVVYQFAQNDDIEGLIQYMQTGQMPSGYSGGTAGGGNSIW